MTAVTGDRVWVIAIATLTFVLALCAAGPRLTTTRYGAWAPRTCLADRDGRSVCATSPEDVRVRDCRAVRSGAYKAEWECR